MYTHKINYIQNIIKVAVFTLIGAVMSHYGIAHHSEWYVISGAAILFFALAGLFVTSIHYYHNKRG